MIDNKDWSAMMIDCKGVLFAFNGTLFFDSDKHVLARESCPRIFVVLESVRKNSRLIVMEYPTTRQLNICFIAAIRKRN